MVLTIDFFSYLLLFDNVGLTMVYLSKVVNGGCNVVSNKIRGFNISFNKIILQIIFFELK